MANKHIYLLITIVYLTSTDTYFLDDSMGSNLKDLYGDPIDENWQEKRSVEKNHQTSFKSFDDLSNIKKDLTDYDYRNGNAETEVARNIDKKEKRENQIHRKFDESLRETEIEHILSKLSSLELNSLERLMTDENPIVEVDKRELLKRNFDGNDNFNKICGTNMQCEGYACDGYNHSPLKEEPHLLEDKFYNQLPDMKQERHMEDKFYNQIPDKITTKRKLKYKRSSGRATSHEKLLQAKISLLKDNDKRNSEMAKMENSLKSKAANTNGNSEIRIPYRKKRFTDNMLTEKNTEDDRAGEENSKLQEVSLESNKSHD